MYVDFRFSKRENSLFLSSFQHALELMNDVQEKFQQRRFHQALFPSLWFNQRELNLPEGCNYAYTMLNDAHKLHAIEIYFQCFQQSVENNGILELFAHFVDEPCFDQLRTKEQLGYIVNSGVRRSRGVQGFRVIVQSARDLEHVNRRIELFLDSVKVRRNTSNSFKFNRLELTQSLSFLST